MPGVNIVSQLQIPPSSPALWKLRRALKIFPLPANTVLSFVSRGHREEVLSFHVPASSFGRLLVPRAAQAVSQQTAFGEGALWHPLGRVGFQQVSLAQHHSNLSAILLFHKPQFLQGVVGPPPWGSISALWKRPLLVAAIVILMAFSLPLTSQILFKSHYSW